MDEEYFMEAEADMIVNELNRRKILLTLEELDARLNDENTPH